MDFKDKRIIESLLGAAMAAGYTVDVYDGGETTVRASTDKRAIMGALETTDDDRLTFRVGGRRVGMVYLVHGNEPGEIICDHSDVPGINAIVAVAERTAKSLGV